MRYVPLGRSGLKVPRLCLGSAGFGDPAGRTWIVDKDAARALVRAALDRGVNFLDTGPSYGGGLAETILGAALEGVPRHEVVLTSKVYFPSSADAGPNARGLSRKHIMAAIDESLRKLKTDHLDVYMIHRWDEETPIEETLQALDEVVRAGKALYLGASSMPAWRLMKAISLQREQGWAPFVCMQNYMNLLYREEEREMLPLCAEEGVGVLCWSPLARGLLTGDAADANRLKGDKFVAERFLPDLDTPVIDALARVAAARKVPPARVALAWLLSRPAVVAPVVGAGSIAELDESLAALDITLDETEIAALEAPYRPHPVLGM